MSGSILTEARLFNQGENKTVEQQRLLSAVQKSASFPLVSSVWQSSHSQEVKVSDF